MESKGLFQFDIITNVLVSSFEYLCYESTVIRNSLILSALEPSLYVRIWRQQSQILTYKDGSRAEGVNQVI